MPERRFVTPWPSTTRAWARARGWALWKAVITLAQAQQAHLDLDATTHRFGWRTGARELVDLVLDDHRGVAA